MMRFLQLQLQLPSLPAYSHLTCYTQVKISGSESFTRWLVGREASRPHCPGRKARTLTALGMRPCAPTALGARPHSSRAIRAQDLMPRVARVQGLAPRVVRVQGLMPMQFELVFCSPLPLGAKRLKSSVNTKNVQVSLPPEHRTTMPCTFTGWQKAFVGPHHQTKISRQKQPINH